MARGRKKEAKVDEAVQEKEVLPASDAGGQELGAIEGAVPAAETYADLLPEPSPAPEPEPEPHAVTACPARPEAVDGEPPEVLEMVGRTYCALCVPADPTPCPERPTEKLAQVVVRLDCNPPLLGVRRADGSTRPTVALGDLPPSVRVLVDEVVAHVRVVPGACGCPTLWVDEGGGPAPLPHGVHHADCELR